MGLAPAEKIGKADYLPTSCFIQWDRAGRTDAVCACFGFEGLVSSTPGPTPTPTPHPHLKLSAMWVLQVESSAQC